MKINLSHGNGGSETSSLINGIFMKHFKNEISEAMEDSAVLDTGSRIAFTSDSFVVRPLFFPGGDIGRLAVCGTVNDLLTSGSVPQYLSACFILEDGLDTDELERIVISMASAASQAGVKIVTGDTKVVEGSGGLYINTSGIGRLEDRVSFRDAHAGDRLIVTGNLGDHHACILSQRLGVDSGIRSDNAPLTDIVSSLRRNGIKPHGMRDVTRGGLATVLCEIAGSTGLAVEVREEALPVSERTAGFARIMGLDTMYMGNEGVMLIAVPDEQSHDVLDIIRRCRYGENAAIVGSFAEGKDAVLRTRLGGERLLRPLTGLGLPRIC